MWKILWKKRWCYLFLAPFFLLFFIFTVLPVLTSFVLSVTSYNLLEPPEWVGLDNYVRLFMHDDVFPKAVVNTFTIALIVGSGGYMLSLLLAWSINELNPKLRSVLVLLIYTPSLVSSLFTIWMLLLSGDAYGYLNGMLLSLGIIQEPVQWLTDPQYMLGVLIVVSLWMSMGTGFLSFVAGLQGVDQTLFEAGAVDGIRNRWQELWFITIPSMKPQLLFGAIMSITSSFTVGGVSMQLFGLPSTDYAAHTLLLHMMDHGSSRMEFGYSCAISAFLFCVMLFCNKMVQRLLRKVGS